MAVQSAFDQGREAAQAKAEPAENPYSFDFQRMMWEAWNDGFRYVEQMREAD